MVVTMWILKTYRYKHPYLECEYRNSYPTYWFKEKEMEIWSTGMTKNCRTYVPIGYVYENT